MPSSLRSARHRRLAALLIAAREKAELKQSDLARALGRHQPFISNIEAGQRRIDVVEFLDIAELLGLDPHVVVDQLLETRKDDPAA